MRVHCEWGLHGMERLRDRVALFVIVDVLSFSTAVDIATGRGARIYPFAHEDGPNAAGQAESYAARHGALLARPRRAAGGQFSLSPASLMRLTPGTALMLPSPNGSRLSLAASGYPLFTGCLRNAGAVANAARHAAAGGDIAIVPAGERWPDGSLRPAIEDWLGAGAIIAALGLPCSAEAETARLAFEAARPDLARLIRASTSGQDLIESGFADDVEIAVALDASSGAPRLRDGAYRL